MVKFLKEIFEPRKIGGLFIAIAAIHAVVNRVDILKAWYTDPVAAARSTFR